MVTSVGRCPRAVRLAGPITWLPIGHSSRPSGRVTPIPSYRTVKRPAAAKVHVHTAVRRLIKAREAALARYRQRY